MTHVKDQSTLLRTRAARLGLLLVVVLAPFCFTACDSPTNTPAVSNAQATPAEQPAAPRQRYWVTVSRVKPEMATQFREFYLKETLPAQQKAGVKQQSVWTTATLGEAFEYVTIRPIEGMQYFDEPSPLVKALGEEGARKWGAKRATMIVSSRSYVMQSRPEMSLAPNPNDAPKLAFVTHRSIAPGRETEYENYVKTDVLPIMKKVATKGLLMTRVGNGGDNEEYHSVALLDSFADYGKWTEALVKEGYDKVTPKRAGIVMHQASAVYRYVPELSIRPGTQQAVK